MTQTEYHVLRRDGDGTADVEMAVLDAGSPQGAGLHQYFYVARANQTVVLALSAASPIAETLRGTPGWEEPNEP